MKEVINVQVFYSLKDIAGPALYIGNVKGIVPLTKISVMPVTPHALVAFIMDYNPLCSSSEGLEVCLCQPQIV